MLMEIKAISEALKYLQQQGIKKAVIVTDSMSTLQKVKKELLYADWFNKLSMKALLRNSHGFLALGIQEFQAMNELTVSLVLRSLTTI